MDIGRVVFDHDIDSKRIIDAIFEPDDVGAIIRIHFEAERAIDYTLSKFTEGRFEPSNSRWSFSQKIELLRLIGVPSNWLAPIKTLNKHRNEFAHVGKTTIQSQEAMDLLRQMNQMSSTITEDFMIHIEGDIQISKILHEFSTKEKYVILIAILCSLIASLPYLENENK